MNQPVTLAAAFGSVQGMLDAAYQELAHVHRVTDDLQARVAALELENQALRQVLAGQAYPPPAQQVMVPLMVHSEADIERQKEGVWHKLMHEGFGPALLAAPSPLLVRFTGWSIVAPESPWRPHELRGRILFTPVVAPAWGQDDQ